MFSNSHIFIILSLIMGLSLSSATSANRSPNKHILVHTLDKYAYYDVFFDKKNNITRHSFIRVSDKKILSQGFPHGIAAHRLAIKHINFKPSQFKVFMAQRVKELKKKRDKANKTRSKSASRSASVATTADCSTTNPSTCSTGLPIGYNSSTGYVGSSAPCINYQTASSGGYTTNTALTQQTSVSSLSQSLNLSASISGAYDGFSASDGFSFSKNVNTTSNNTQTFYYASTALILDSQIDSTTPLTSYGTTYYTNGTFPAACGTQYMETVLAGFYIDFSIVSASSNSSTATAINNAFSASAEFGADTLNTAVTSVQNAGQSSTSFTAIAGFVGGGEEAQNMYMNGNLTPNAQGVMAPPSGQPSIVGAQSSQAITDQQNCFTFVAGACTAYVADVTSAASEAMIVFQTNNPAGSLPLDLSDFAVFPSGINGQNPEGYTVPTTTVIPTTGSLSDIYRPYEFQINNFLNVLNQISILQNFSKTLSNMNSAFDMAGYNIIGTLQTLSSTYSNDFIAMMGSNSSSPQNLSLCLGNTTTLTNITTNCANVIGIFDVNSAYDFYSAAPQLSNASSSNALSAAQNSIALPYYGYYTANSGWTGDGSVWGGGQGRVNLNAIWSTGLPVTVGPNIANASAMVLFTPTTWYSASQTVIAMNQPYIAPLTALNNGVDMTNLPDPGNVYGWGGITSITPSPTNCTQSANYPCSFTLNNQGNTDNSGGQMNYNSNIFAPAMPISGGL
jgi:hypothetical protein